jgi:putative FmdB family regulatory protein
MPIYEYICKECGQEFDALRSMKDADNPIECKNCHSIQTMRVISAFFAASNGKSLTPAASGCGGCGGGKTCSSCNH